MSRYREIPLSQQPPKTELPCNDGPTQYEFRSVVRSWWPISKEGDLFDWPDGIYVRIGARGGHFFQWFTYADRNLLWRAIDLKPENVDYPGLPEFLNKIGWA